MASRRSAQRFLAVLGKAASAGFFPALAVIAVLAFSGCGDSSSDTTATGGGTDGSGTTTAAAGDESKQGSADQPGGPGKGGASDGQEGESKQSKRGSKVVIPKGEPEPKITPEQRKQATIADISLEAPGLKKVGRELPLPAAYTCDGKDTWPELSWKGLPPEAQELVLFMINLNPVGDSLFFDWAVAGMDPSLEGIEAGRLPAGAVVGRNGFGKLGYSVCPPKGESESFILILYALPKALSPKQGFDPMELREEALAQAGNAGLLAVSYARG